MSDEQDGITEDATTPTRIKGKTSESSTQAKRQVTVTADSSLDKVLLDVASQNRGLTVEGKVTEVTIDDTGWTALPATPLIGRNAMAIQNKSGVDCKIKYNSTGGYVDGMIIEDDEERSYDITDNIIVFGRASVGTIVLFIEELA